MKDMIRDIRSLTESELLEWCQAHGEPLFRGRQILDWLYGKTVEHWTQMSNLPTVLKEKLSKAFVLNLPEVVKVQGAVDTTRKFLLKLSDHQWIETVLIPASMGLYGEKADRLTLCVSTQVGCAYGCKFCASGMDGFRRNLTSAEIVGEWIRIQKEAGQRIGNLVFMGMGEPLANYENLMRAIQILNAPWGMGLGARKITISTSGLAPQIEQLALEEGQIRLAISLHGARDEVRHQIMPVNRKYPLTRLMTACEKYQALKGRLITFEYILLKGINDDLSEVPHLARLARRAHAKVNLIPFNEVEGTSFQRPDDGQCERFCEALSQEGIISTLRKEKGHDIDAACGQLRLRQVQSEKIK